MADENIVAPEEIPQQKLGLVDLKNKTAISEPKRIIPPSEGLALSARSQSNEPVKYKRGDDLMAQAMAAEKVDNAYVYQTRLFMESQKMVQDRLNSDPEFAQKVFPELKKLAETGDDAYMNKMIDEADNMKIEQLKQENPEWFGGARAASYGFLNSISFGQLSKIAGKAGELIDGTPYEQTVEKEAEKVRLLHKAFPGMTLLGEATTFLVPGSPVKMLFAKSAGMALKVAGNIAPSIAKLSKNPKLLQRTMTAAIEGFGGTAAISGVKNTLGKDFQEFSLDRGASNSLKDGATVGLLSAMLPVAGKTAAVIGAPIAGAVKSGARSVGKTIGSLSEAVSGTSTEAIRAYRKDPKLIREAAGTESTIGENLLDFLWNKKKARLLEHDAADALLDKLPVVDGTRLVSYLKGFKAGNNPKRDATVTTLNEWGVRIEKSVGDVTKIPARKMREIVDDLQDEADDAFLKESNYYFSAIKAASRRARVELVETAKKLGGEDGAKYSDLMDKVADKTRVLKFIGKQLGRNAESQIANASTFYRKIFGKNEKIMQQRMAQLDEMFGTEINKNYGEGFLQRFKNANYAKKLGPDGTPQFFPSQTTGRTQLGSLVGEGAGAVVGGAVGTVLGAAGAVGGVALGSRLGKAAGTVTSSPRMQSVIVGASDKITGFVGRMLDRPDVMSRLAGDIFKVPGGKSVRMSVPNEVKVIAKELKNTLDKDGPLSAASTTRLIADTPYFLGLVHYFEIAERSMTAKGTARAVAKTKAQYDSEIANKQ